MASPSQSLPIRQSTDPNITAPSPDPLDILPHLTTWLTHSSPSIQKFWIGASWRSWARFDLYLLLLNTLPSPNYLLNHSIPLSDIFPSSSHTDDEELDIHIEPSDSNAPQLGLILRCERVNENCGSFERFRAEMDGDIERISGLVREGGDESASAGGSGWFEGMKLFVVGISGPFPGENEDTEWRCRPIPKQVEIDGGEVNLWVYEVGAAETEIGKDKNGENGTD